MMATAAIASELAEDMVAESPAIRTTSPRIAGKKLVANRKA